MSDALLDSNKPRFRSPPYPAFPLSKAIERARQLYSKALHHPAGVNVLAGAWGYKEKSSGLWATAAALIHYGLVKDEGSGEKRKFILTDAAMRIIRDGDINSIKRKEAVARAALSPSIFVELREKYGSSLAVSDIVLKNYLTLDRSDDGKAPFSDQSADDVIRIYRETMLFAGLAEIDIVSGPLEDIGDGFKDDPIFDSDGSVVDDQPPAPKKDVKIMAGERELATGLLSKDASFRLIVTGKIGEKEIERLIKKLELDKEILADDDIDLIEDTDM